MDSITNIAESLEKRKNFVIPLLLGVILGGGGFTASGFMAKETNANSSYKKISNIEMRLQKLDDKIYSELKEMNTRLSKIEGQLLHNK